VQIRSRRHQPEWLVPAVYPEELVDNGEPGAVVCVRSSRRGEDAAPG
jgi:hypothetical protein